MATIDIHNLGPISKYHMDIKKFNLLIGEQATGKSTISKCIYFFRTLKSELVEHLYSLAVDLSYAKENQFPRTLNKSMKDIFVQLFGFSWDLDEKLYLAYHFTENVDITLSLEKGKKERKYIGIYYSDYLYKNIRSLERAYKKADQVAADSFSFASTERARLHKEILEKVNDLFDDKYETYYIPAGRQLLTLLASQKTKLDYDSIDLVNRKFMQFNESIQSRFEHGISNAHKFYPIPNRKFDTGRISSEIRSGLKGDYRVTSAGERLRLDNGNDIPVNYASSGQQEILWLYNQLYILMLREEKAFVIIEEPEAHLYPALQKAVIEFITQFSNMNQSTVLVTTHSPYVLTAANVLYYAGRLGKKFGNQVGRVVGKDKWIAPDEFTAFKLEQDEQGHTNAESLVDDGTEELRTSLIDEISNKIGETYTKLYYLEVDNEDT